MAPPATHPPSPIWPHPPRAPARLQVMREFPDARIAYGTSDEYSFVLHHSTSLYGAAAPTRRGAAALLLPMRGPPPAVPWDCTACRG
jgi:hypothetical protein